MVALATALAQRERALERNDFMLAQRLEATILETAPADLPDVVAMLQLTGSFLADRPGASRFAFTMALAAAFIDDIAPFNIEEV